MATHEIIILTASTIPDSSGNVFLEPYTIKATNDTWKHLVAIFNDTATRDILYGAFFVPNNYVGGGAFKVYWTSTATTGNVVWDLDYRAVGGDDAESLDQATAQEALTVTDAAPTAAHNVLKASMTATAANFAPLDVVEFLLARDGANASDTMAAAAIVQQVTFSYSDA